jgi:DNA invertase Pin-like site-specific DNA recombinase
MARVYSYIRFSDAKQAAGASVERQGAYAKDWADRHGLVLDTELSMRDEGLSAFHQKHVTKGALGAFLVAVEAGRVPPGSVLIVEGLDRLSRAEPIQAQAQLASIINAGISVVTASDGKEYSRERLKANPMDLVYSLLVMIRAHEESDTKSKRVTDAIRRQCKGWIDGTFRGMVKIGNTPSWLRVVDGKWEFVEEHASAVRLAIELYMAGNGPGRIMQELTERGLAMSAGEMNSGHLVRLLTRPNLVGEKHVTLGDETFVLKDYYPPLIDRATWDELQSLGISRGRARVKGNMPSVLTGSGITFCGYCGSPMKAQFMLARQREDGSLPDANRRLQCTSVNAPGGCVVKQSCSSAHIERALMAFCSDVMNLRSLYRSDAAAGPAAALAKARQRHAELQGQLDKLTELMLQSDGPIPKAFVKRGNELEREIETALQAVERAERAVGEVSRAEGAKADQSWSELAAAVDAMNYEARMKARQLVADTFSRIVVYGRGIRPGELPRGSSEVILIAKSGISRGLLVDRTGGWALTDDPPAA